MLNLHLRKYIISIVAVFFAGYSISAFSQDNAIQNPPKENYQQQLQQLMNNTESQAKSQFDKNYPKPTVPKTPPLEKQSSPPPSENNLKDKNAVQGWQAPDAWQQPQGWQQPGSNAGSEKSAQPQNNQSPGGSSTQQNNQNIYAPGGEQSNHQSSNPYR
jgi:hypothetical protein